MRLYKTYHWEECLSQISAHKESHESSEALLKLEIKAHLKLQRLIKAKQLLDAYSLKYPQDNSLFKADVLYRSGYWLEAEYELKTFLAA